MSKIFFLIIINVLFSLYSYAQIGVDDSQNIIDVVKKLEGPGVKISNISYRFSPKAEKKPAGYFTDDFGVIGLDKGLLLTSGAAVNAIGPNDNPYITQINHDTLQDPDLIPYIDKYDDSTYYDRNRMADVCYVEFDLVTSFPFLSFNYVFGSEEYVQTLEFHDIFVFLISGPGISGKKNIALVPNTNLPVSTQSIRPTTKYFPGANSQYYIDNGTGSTPFINLDLQYNGYTKVLKAVTSVIPCQTYHIKLAIADVLDDTYDAGVFIEQGSFKSEPVNLKVLYEFPRFNSAIEGCNDAKVIFKRSPYSDTTQALVYKFNIKGNALNGTDYVLIPDSIVIPAGEDSAYVTIDPLADGLADNGEMVRLVIHSHCATFPDPDSIDIFIQESFPYFISSEKICAGQSVTLNKSFIPGDSIFWDANSSLSCNTCSSPIASAPSSVYFGYVAKDTASGCTVTDSVLVQVIDLKADFSFNQDPCYTSLDFFFINTSQNASTYRWDFGDNAISLDENPSHQFPFLNKKDPVQYTVSLQVSRDAPSCSIDTSLTINIYNPLFIPNLITADHNGKNDSLEILGINTECWNLHIYNRWGTLVYKNENYKNNFTGEELAQGVYFYHLQNYRKDREFKGWVQIINE